ncbi:dTDP-4-dehydrorhamnose reductase [Dokdonella sp. MW10]|uniref:dTDP-4-dehydrorhamnose reductase n=1 Tax=Dokdonella sp. MW10 TaxID=2992926 RepID=UPI003F817447
MRILLLGANGQVGHALRAPLARVGDVIATTRDGRLDEGGDTLACDLTDPASLVATLDRAGADIIVNATAYTAVDRAESEPGLADRVNHLAVGEIGAWAARHDALVVHYSTDYVFAGDTATPYHESDATAPAGVYGRTKRDGEDALRASGARHLILRTAWVYGARGHNFLRTMLRLAAERDELRVVDDQIGSPTPAPVIATMTAELLRRWLALPAHDRTQALGTYHLTCRGHGSWASFAEAIVNAAAEAGVIARAPRVTRIATADYPTPARRPAWSVLDTTKLALVFGLQSPTWEEGLRAVMAEIAAART